MRMVSFTEARNSLKTVLDGVVNDVDTTVITHRDSEDVVDNQAITTILCRYHY